MSLIADALKICPELRLVDGSDLTPFREASQEINELWYRKMKVYGLTALEKKGFDETFMDVTEIVKHRISKSHGQAWQSDSAPRGYQFEGTVIGDYETGTGAADNQSQSKHDTLLYLSVASQLAKEWR